MRQLLALFVLTALLCAVPATTRAAAGKKAPQPSEFPIAWQFEFTHGSAKRIVVGDTAYWYLTYTVTNNTGQEQIWAPAFEMLTIDGTVVKSDRKLAPGVFDRIKAQEHSKFMEPYSKIAGTLHQGVDQAKDGVAIWKEPNPRMGEFQIFVQNLTGEAVKLTDDDGKELKNEEGMPVFVRKTLQINYAVYGDEYYPQRHDVHELGETWVMR